MSCRTIGAFVVFAIVTQVASGVPMDLTAENVRDVFRDFAYELSQVQADSINGDGHGRGLRSIQDSFSSLPVIGDFDIDVSLSDFIDGVLQTPIFDFVSDVPQDEAGWEKTMKKKYKEFCTNPQKEKGEVLLQKCEGPEITLELVPGICTVIDRDHSKFECEPPRLEYTRTGPECESSYREAAEFVDKECKFVQQLGVEKELILGGGTKDTHLTFGRRDVGSSADFDVSEIMDVVSGLFSDLLDFPDVSNVL